MVNFIYRPCICRTTKFCLEWRFFAARRASCPALQSEVFDHLANSCVHLCLEQTLSRSADTHSWFVALRSKQYNPERKKGQAQGTLKSQKRVAAARNVQHIHLLKTESHHEHKGQRGNEYHDVLLFVGKTHLCLDGNSVFELFEEFYSSPSRYETVLRRSDKLVGTTRGENQDKISSHQLSADLSWWFSQSSDAHIGDMKTDEVLHCQTDQTSECG